MQKALFKLFVAGDTIHTRRAIGNLSEICRERFGSEYEILIIDVLDRPQLAEEERILATPTVVKLRPPPVRRMTGDFSDHQRVLDGLSLA